MSIITDTRLYTTFTIPPEMVVANLEFNILVGHEYHFKIEQTEEVEDTILSSDSSTDEFEDITLLERYPDDLTELDCSLTDITSLEGCPNNLTKLNCSYTHITSLEGCPNSLTKLDCIGTHISSLNGCPNSLKILDCHHALYLTSLEGCSNSLKILDCRYTEITSLEGCPNSLTELDCSHTGITSLEGCPNSLMKLDCRRTNIETLGDFPPLVSIYTDITILQDENILINAAHKIQSWWRLRYMLKYCPWHSSFIPHMNKTHKKYMEICNH